VNIWQSDSQEETNTITYHMQKDLAAISFLLCRSRCIQSHCGNFSIATLCVF